MMVSELIDSLTKQLLTAFLHSEEGGILLPVCNGRMWESSCWKQSLVLMVQILTMLGGVMVVLYSAELYRGLQWLLSRFVWSRKKASEPSHHKHHQSSSEPYLDATESSAEDDDHSLYVVFKPSHHRLDGVGTRWIAESSGSSSQLSGSHDSQSELLRRALEVRKQMRKRRDLASFSRIPEEETPLATTMHHSEGADSNNSHSDDYCLSSSLASQSWKENDDGEDVTVCRSNASAEAWQRESSTTIAEPTTTNNATTGTTPPRNKRLVGQIPAAVLKSNLSKGQIPSRFQRSNANASSSISSSSPSKALTVNPQRRRSGRRSSDQDDAAGVAASETASAETGSTNSTKHRQFVSRNLRPSRSMNLDDYDVVPKRRHASRRGFSDEGSKHLMEDYRLLERMMRSVRSEREGGTTDRAPAVSSSPFSSSSGIGYD
ncbi:hypothetical protein ACA910_020929 [Epithemia clementina (nom. ined.)]